MFSPSPPFFWSFDKVKSVQWVTDRSSSLPYARGSCCRELYPWRNIDLSVQLWKAERTILFFLSTSHLLYVKSSVIRTQSLSKSRIMLFQCCRLEAVVINNCSTALHQAPSCLTSSWVPLPIQLPDKSHKNQGLWPWVSCRALLQGTAPATHFPWGVQPQLIPKELTGTRSRLKGSFRSAHLHHLHASQLEAGPSKPKLLQITTSKWLFLLETPATPRPVSAASLKQRNLEHREPTARKCFLPFSVLSSKTFQRCHFCFRAEGVWSSSMDNTKGLRSYIAPLQNPFLSVAQAHTVWQQFVKALCKILIHELILLEQVPGGKAVVVGMTAELVFRKQLFFWGIRQPLALCGFWATTSVSIPHTTSCTSLICFVFKLSRAKYP